MSQGILDMQVEDMGGRKVSKTEYFLQAGHLPDNYLHVSYRTVGNNMR